MTFIGQNQVSERKLYNHFIGCILYNKEKLIVKLCTSIISDGSAISVSGYSGIVRCKSWYPFFPLQCTLLRFIIVNAKINIYFEIEQNFLNSCYLDLKSKIKLPTELQFLHPESILSRRHNFNTTKKKSKSRKMRSIITYRSIKRNNHVT